MEPQATSTDSRASAAGAPAAERVALEFLRVMEERDLGSARSMLASDVVMTFPGASYRSLDEMVGSARGRYQWVKKRVQRTESYGSDDGAVVFVSGTLYGVNLDGVPFEDVRFIDRFEVVGGLIARQEVWNDLAESGVLSRRA